MRINQQMGVNNLLRYLKDAKIDVQIDSVPEEYNLSIDLATIIVPIMQKSADKNDFICRLRSYLIENNRFVTLLLNACEVRVYLDMFSPRMKIDTLDNRKRERLAKSCHDNSVPGTGRWEKNRMKHSIKVKNTEGDVKQAIKLREVRHFIASTLLKTLCEFDKTFKFRCSFDVYRIGEGEIKCMSYHGMCRPNLPNVIFSNDNDVLLMILLHEPHKALKINAISSTSPNYYRVMVDRHRPLKKVNQQGSDMIVHRFEINTIESCRWILVVWIICLCGTDFVLPIAMITPYRRKTLLERCVMSFKRQQCAMMLCRHFNFDNFFIIMTVLFDILADNGKGVYLPSFSKEDNAVPFVESSPAVLSKYMNERLDKMAKWCARVYWNILYFIDLPIDFHLQDNRMFKSNKQMAVNSYIENVSISFWSLFSLNAMHYHFLYHKIKGVCRLHDKENEFKK